MIGRLTIRTLDPYQTSQLSSPDADLGEGLENTPVTKIRDVVDNLLEFHRLEVDLAVFQLVFLAYGSFL